MGYFDGLVNASFKTDKQGTTLFYKWCVLGNAYIIPNADKESEIRKFLMLYYKVSLPLIIGAGTLLKLIFAVLLCIPLFIWFQIKISSLTKGLTISNEKLTIKESYTNSARGHKKSTLWLLFILSILFVISGLIILLAAKDLNGKLIGAGCVIFFGACSVVYIYMLKIKRT